MINFLRCMFFLFLALALLTLPGCTGTPNTASINSLTTPKAADAPAYVAFLVDGTYSSAENRKKGLEHLSFLLKPGTLPKGSQINILRVDCAPKSIWSGKVSGCDREIVDAFSEALDNSHQCGTDGCSAYTKALDWLLSEGQKNPSARLILTGYHDGVADPCKTGKGNPHPAQEETFTWPGAKEMGVEVTLFGVSEDLLPRLQSSWSPRLDSLNLYPPSHRITREDLGFNTRSLF